MTSVVSISKGQPRPTVESEYIPLRWGHGATKLPSIITVM